MHHWLIASILVWAAVAIAVIYSVGVAVMRSALERLHFSAIITTFSAWLMVVAVWLDDPNWQARLKVICVAVILGVMNSILSHATARAIRIRQAKHFEPQREDNIPLITDENPTGIRDEGKS